MPEKWRKELSKLPQLKDPGEGWRRAQQGPERPLPRPSTGQRLAAGAVAFAVFAGGIALALGAFGTGNRPVGDEAAPGGPAPIVLRFFVDTESGESYPNATMQVGNSVIEGKGASFSWELDGGIVMADTFGTEFDFQEWTEVPAAAPVQIEGDAGSVEGWVGEWHPKDFEVVRLMGLPAAGAALPTEPGRYVLEFSASWSQGGRTFYFPVQVVEEAPIGSGNAVLSLRAAPDSPVATLAWAGADIEGVFGSYCWEQETATRCADVFLSEPDGYFSMPVGTVVELDSDAESLAVSLSPVGPSREGPLFYDEDHPVGFPLVLDVEPGEYLLGLRASWPQGDVPIYFPIEVAPLEGVGPAPTPEPGSGLVVTLDAPDDGSLPSAAFAYEGREQSFGMCGGRWNGEPVLCTLMLLAFEARIEPGSLLMVQGDATEVHAEIRAQMSDGRWEPDPTVLDLASGGTRLPSQAGFYSLLVEGTWPEGRVSTEVAITIGDPPEHTEPPLPEVEVGVVPDLVGINAGDAGKLLWQAGLEERVVYEPVAGVAGGVVVSTDPPAGTDVGEGTMVTLVVSGTTVSLDGYLTPLACSMDDMMPFDENAVDEPAGDAYIRLNVEGVEPSDEVVQASTDPDLWHMIRSGDVLAVIDYETLQGAACRGSGIGGV